MLRPDVKEAWQLLRRIALHYLRGNRITGLTWQQFGQNAKHAHDMVVEYGKKVEAIFGESACTYNLHTLACRGYEQELAEGPASRATEWWIERHLQGDKQRVALRAHNRAEAVLANDLMDELGLKRTKAQAPSAQLQTWAELQQHGPQYSPTHIDFRGAPMTMKASECTNMRTALSEHWRTFCIGDDSRWTAGDLQYAELQMYHHCMVRCNGNMVTLPSMSYKRTAATASPYVLVTYDYRNVVEHYVARVQVFVKALPPPNTGLQPLHLAIADLFSTTCLHEDDDRLLEVRNMDPRAPLNYESYPVKVSDIREPVIALTSESTPKGYFIFDDPDEDV